MSENLKEEIARELGVYDQVKKDGGWENVPSKTCGNIVSKAIEIANRSVNSQFKNAKNISLDIFSIFLYYPYTQNCNIKYKNLLLTNITEIL